MRGLLPFPPRAVIDVDTHVIETPRTGDFLGPDEQHFRPRLVPASAQAGLEQWRLGDAVLGFRDRVQTDADFRERARRSGRPVVTPRAARELDDVPARLADMDRLGVTTQVLHNSLWIRPVTADARAEAALCRAWNRWVAQASAQSQGRLRWCCVVPALDREAAVEQMRNAAAHGAVGCNLRPYEAGRALTDPYFEPLYEAAQALRLAMVVHIGNGSAALQGVLHSPHDRGANFAAARLPAVATCLALLLSTLPQRYPGLRWGFIEASAQWVPWLAHEYRRRRKRGASSHNPFEHARIHVAAQADDDLPWILRYCGPHCLVMGTDYGHADTAAELDALRRLGRDGRISRRTRRAILQDNPRALFPLLGAAANAAPARGWWSRGG